MQSVRKNGRVGATREVLRSNDTAKRSAEIVVAARELYEEKGLAHTSIQDITNHVGVTRSLFYHYFQNKEEVTSAVLDQYITAWPFRPRRMRRSTWTSSIALPPKALSLWYRTPWPARGSTATDPITSTRLSTCSLWGS